MKKLALILTLIMGTLLASSAALAGGVMLGKSQALGSFLTDDKGMTLYWFTKDSPGNSACAGPCVDKWPLFHAMEVSAPEGTAASDFGSITRADGKMQSTFKGYPLYYFAGDKAAGDTAGQGLNNVWFVIDPMKFPPAK